MSSAQVILRWNLQKGVVVIPSSSNPDHIKENTELYHFSLTEDKLYKWKEGKHRKPLIIEGARQVGKTWLMKEFGSKAYDDIVYINFDSNSRMAELFASDLNTDRLLMGIELYAGRKIDPDNTLLIFDEVQEVPRALSSLKYFYENAPQYHIICAGSLLGIALHHGTFLWVR